MSSIFGQWLAMRIASVISGTGSPGVGDASREHRDTGCRARPPMLHRKRELVSSVSTAVTFTLTPAAVNFAISEIELSRLVLVIGIFT